MRARYLSFALLGLAMLTMTSCLNTDDEDVTYYHDTAITSFTLGTLKQTIHTLSSKDEDSTYVADFDASKYVMYIDQLNGLIYNPDSLPVGVDASKVVCTVSAKNSGTVVIKDEDSDTLKYVGSDSIDFNKERIMYVYANDFQSRRMYKVNVNVHKEVGDTLVWRDAVRVNALSGLKGVKAVAMGNDIYAFGTDGTSTKVYRSSIDNANGWSEISTSATLDASAYSNAYTDNKHLYIYSGSSLMSSSDGATWQTIPMTGSVKRLLGADGGKVYALGTDGKIKVSDNGAWADDKMEDDADAVYVPTDGVSCLSLPDKTNSDVSRLLLIGQTANASHETKAVVWGKLQGNVGDVPSAWSYYNQNSENKYNIPVLRNFTACNYDGGILALGADTKAEAGEAFTSFYFSIDGGIAWRNEPLYRLPESFDCDSSVFTIATDAKNHVWIIDGRNGKVWRGWINRLAWAWQAVQ